MAPLLWMGQALGFLVMTSCLGIWKQVALVAGTKMGIATSWRAIILALGLQAASRLSLGLSTQLDPYLMKYWLFHWGLFQILSIGIACTSIWLISELWCNVLKVNTINGILAELISKSIAVISIVIAFASTSSAASFIELITSVAVSGTGIGMFLLAGKSGPNLNKVRAVSALGIIIGLPYAFSAYLNDGVASITSTIAAFSGSILMIVALHLRIKEMSRSRVHVPVLKGILIVSSAWLLLFTLGPLLWFIAGKPQGALKEYILLLGLLSSLGCMSWFFRDLNLAVGSYIEKLGADRVRAMLVGVNANAFVVNEYWNIVEASTEGCIFIGESLQKLYGSNVWRALGLPSGNINNGEYINVRGKNLMVAISDLGQDHLNRKVITVRDQTNEKVAQAALNKAATEDELTGLPNRRQALFNMETAIRTASISNQPQTFGVLFFDLDHFKNVNDTEGHDAGDALLKEVASVLNRCVMKGGGWLARLGGDEFLGVLPNADSVHCQEVAAQCINAMEQSQKAASGSVGVSVGISMYPNDGENGDDLIRRADSAMYDAKLHGRGRCSFFGPEIESRLRRRVQVDSFLREAIRKNEGLELYLQPICTPDGEFKGKAEALIRAPGFVNLHAAELIDVAEHSGLIVPLGRWVLQRALEIMADAQRNQTPLKLNINVSTKQFSDPLFWEQLREAVALGKIPNGLTLEITESTLINDHLTALALLTEAQQLGISIALDDFGAGYSSMSMIKKMPLDKIKIDKSLIDDIPESKEAQRIALAAIAMIEALGLDVVVEGVESETQALWLKKRNIQSVQGYFYAKPMAPGTLFHLISGPAPIMLIGEPRLKTIA